MSSSQDIIRMPDRLILQLLYTAGFACFLSVASQAATINVKNSDGAPLATAMVTRKVAGADSVDTSDNGYPKPGFINMVVPQHTRFTDADGVVSFDALEIGGERSYRIRKPGYADAVVKAADDNVGVSVILEELVDPQAIADSKPANLWLSALNFNWADDPAQAREHFALWLLPPTGLRLHALVPNRGTVGRYHRSYANVWRDGE